MAAEGENAIPPRGIQGGWRRIAKEVDERHGRVDIVVNNAAYYPHAELEELSLDAWQRTITVNAVLPAITNGRHGGDARRR